MAKDFDLTSQKWLNLVFEGKNKEYGAYELRVDSSDRHIKSMIIVTIVGLAAIFLPNLIKSVLPEAKDLTQDSVVTMTEFVENNLEEEQTIKQPEDVPPPPLLKETLGFTETIIAHDEEVDEKDMLIMQDLNESKTAISVTTVEGVVGGTVDIADLREHKVIVEDDSKKVWDHVEVEPSFQGGTEALMKWLHDNVNFPTVAQENGVSGRVVVKFVVLSDGSIGDVLLLQSLDPSCDKEALTKVKRMPKWIPGKQNGNAVNVWFQLPISFRLSN
ncbi:MAG: energy transducer TonB [Candidatus Symbiothrix sp.]|jgi:protein TonB|nr:energy transducer TonB [Candidatus Symbiothrix sp.]